MKQLIKIAKKISIFVLMISAIGCNNDNLIYPEVVAKFTYTINQDTGSVTFINISKNSNKYVWDFGDGTSSQEINPVKTYANGTYKVVLKATNFAGASNTFEDNITISIPQPINLPVTFDDTNVVYDVGVFNGSSFEIVDNPDVSGTNNKASKVGAITNSGAAYEGISLDVGTQIDFATKKAITMNFWANAPVDVLMKFENGTGPDIEVTSSYGGSGWETLSFYFNSSDKYSRLTLFVDGPGTSSGTFYIDDIEQIAGTPPVATEPTTSVTAPTQAEANVISVYSDAYSNNISSTDFNPNWGQSTVYSEFDLNGDKILKYENLNYQGIQLGSTIDASSMTTLHMDIWTPDLPTVDIFAVSGSSGEKKISKNLTASAWTSIDIPLADFTSQGLTLSDIIQFKFDAQAYSVGTIFVDNIYFYTTGSTGGGTSATAPTTAAPTPTEDAANVVSIFSDTYTDIAGVNYNPDWGQSGVNDVNAAFDTGSGNLALAYLNFNYQGIEFASQDLSTMEFMHVDVWTADATDLKVTPVGGGETLVSLTPLNAGQWNSYDIPVTDFTAVNFGAVIQLKFDGQGGVSPSNIYVDNIYFYTTGGSGGGSGSGGGTGTSPSVAAPTPPTRAAADVVSIYSDAYTDITVDNFDAGWCGGAAINEVMIAGNNTLMKNTGIICHGIDFSTNRQDLSAFTHLHFDFYTTDTDLVGDVFNVKLVDFAGGSGEASALEVNINTGTTPAIVAGQWVSVDVDITSLGGVVANNVTRSDIAQIGITTVNLTNVWYDNIYLYK